MKSSFREWVKKNSKKNIRLKHLDIKLVNFLKHYIKKQKIKSIFVYIPLKSEVDINPLIKFARGKRVSIYVPFMEGESFRLVKYRLPLHKKSFGIKEPKFSKQYRVRDIDLAIVPILGIDFSCKRVGFGKGMYDRFFEKEGKFIKETIFIQREIYLSQMPITQNHDIKGSMVLGLKLKVWENRV